MADQQMTQRSRARWEDGFGRRTFLKGTAGAGAFLVVHSAFRLDVAAQETPLATGRRFFNPVEAQTVEAIAERLWPATDDSPGAREAGVVHYIDQALSGPYAQYQLRYRTGLRAIDEAAQEQNDAPFVELTAEQQDALLTSIAAGEVEQPQAGLEAPAPAAEIVSQQVGEGPQIAGLTPITDPSLQSFFDLIRTHTMEGLFADPIYGGNRDFAGWRAVGYPGPYYVYTEEEQQSFEPLDKPFQSIADI